MLLHGRTGCDQANGLLVLVCIYLYGVNFEAPMKGCIGRASTYIYGNMAFTSILTQLALRCSCFSPLPSWGAISGGCAPTRVLLSSALHTYMAKRMQLASLLTLNSTQSCSPLDEPSARSVLESMVFCMPCRELQGKGSSRNMFCITS